MQNLGKYEIISEIGRGAMGAVYKARDPLIDRLVALKTITGGPTAQSNLLDRFYQEARSAGALQHPNIVTIYELGHEKNTPFIAMEYLEGLSLDRLIEQRPVLPLSVKLGYVVRVCEALAYAHQHNVVHRDVKPANIMVTNEGVVKVVDFGIARLTDISMTQPHMMMGSRAYMSPQLYKGERADACSDIWAIGVTLYELLTYRRPFTGDSEAELMFHIIYENPPILQYDSPDCTDELAPIIGKMLEKKSEDRYQSMDDVLRAIEPIWKGAQQATVSGLLADCRELMVAKDLPRAQALLRKALHIDVGNTQAKSMLEKVSMELRRTEILPRLQEHMNRGEGFLKAGQFREARAEAQAALGLDSRHEPAQKLIAEVEAAAAKAQQLEQKLRLTKQRLAEGSLTEAAAALGQVLELDDGNPQAQELKRQIEEERVRREKRKRLSETLHRARTLWTELNYEECLTILEAALEEFPNEPELKKLRETARTDQAEQQKQRQMAELRKLLGQQNFSEARRVLGELIKHHPQDMAVKNLQALALQEEQEQKRQKRLEAELTSLRGLLGAGKFKQVVTKGESLLQEFPQEYELKELVVYARGEAAQQEQKNTEEEREKQVRGFMMRECYAEALEAARRGIEEFPKQDSFRKLAAESEAAKKEQDARENARVEMQRRLREINSNIGQDKITDAIDLAQQTMETMGPDPNVTRLLHGAEEKRKKNESEQERQVRAVRQLVNKGDHAGATQLFNELMASQILQPSHPRAEELRERISSLVKAPQTTQTQMYPAKPSFPKPVPTEGDTSTPVKQGPPQPDVPASGSESSQNISATMFSATRVLGPVTPGSSTDGPAPRHPDSDGKATGARKTALLPGDTAVPGPVVRFPASSPVSGPREPRRTRTRNVPLETTEDEAKPGVRGDRLTQMLPIVRRTPVLAGIGVVLLIIIVWVSWPGTPKQPSEKEAKLKQQAEQLWQEHHYDQSEQIWRQLAQVKGPLQNEAIQQVNQIEQKRGNEQRRFEEGEALLKDKKDYANAQQAFQDVIQMNLWHSDDAARELAAANASLSQRDVHKIEQDHFDRGVQLFERNEYANASKEFRAMLNLDVAGSLLKPQAEGYLTTIRNLSNEQKLYDAALESVKNENWAQARGQLQSVIARKGPQSRAAKEQLARVEKALQAENAIEESLRTGAFRTAKIQLDSAQQWPKTQEKLGREMRATEQQQFEVIRGSAQAAESKGDAPGIQRVQDDLHRFEGRAQEPSLLAQSKDIEKRLDAAYSVAVEKAGEKSAFETAVAHFEQAKQKKDIEQLSHGVIQEFQKIANGTGVYREHAQIFVRSSIPTAIQVLKQTAGKVALPPISCGPGQLAPVVPSTAGAASCAQLDSNPTLQWLGIPTVDFPDVANQPGRLPYTLTLIVTVDAHGSVKIDKEGNVDKDFFKKAKDASKHWKTTVPKSEGKAVGVRFPLTITFER